MDDRFLHDLKKQPAPLFATRLRAALHAIPPDAARVASTIDLRKWLAAAASIAVVSFVFTLPAVQAGAQAFLDLFRVVQFTGVRFDPERLRNLETGGLDLPVMFGDVEPLSAPQPPVSYATVLEAGEVAGMRVRTPAWIPPGYAQTGITVSSDRSARITASTAGLQALLDALGLDDVELPNGLDGEVATLRVPPIVSLTYANGERLLYVVQSRSPDAAFPAGLDLTKLAYAGLRVLGVPQDEAYRMSVTIDWRSTLIVPVPAQAASYRPININGNGGLLIEAFSADEQRGHSLLMWSAGGETFAVGGPVSAVELLEIAQTLQ